MKDKADQCKNIKDQLRELKQSQERQPDRFEQLKSKHTEEMNELKRKHKAQLSENKQDHEEEISELTADLRKSYAELEKLTQEVERLRLLQKTTDEQMKALLEQKIKPLQEERNALKESNTTLQSEIESTKSEHEQIIKSLEEKHAQEISALNQTHKAEMDKHTEKEALQNKEIRQLKKELSKLEELRGVQTEISGVQSDCAFSALVQRSENFEHMKDLDKQIQEELLKLKNVKDSDKEEAKEELLLNERNLETLLLRLQQLGLQDLNSTTIILRFKPQMYTRLFAKQEYKPYNFNGSVISHRYKNTGSGAWDLRQKLIDKEYNDAIKYTQSGLCVRSDNQCDNEHEFWGGKDPIRIFEEEIRKFIDQTKLNRLSVPQELTDINDQLDGKKLTEIIDKYCTMEAGEYERDKMQQFINMAKRIKSGSIEKSEGTPGLLPFSFSMFTKMNLIKKLNCLI